MSYIQEAVRQWAWVYGAEYPDRAWLCSDYDTWERNPHYHGPEVRHPEDDCYDDYEVSQDEVSRDVLNDDFLTRFEEDQEFPF